jgi:hypothetical protein
VSAAITPVGVVRAGQHAPCTAATDRPDPERSRERPRPRSAPAEPQTRRYPSAGWATPPSIRGRARLRPSRPT